MTRPTALRLAIAVCAVGAALCLAAALHGATLKHGTGFNPYPTLPDPWEIAVSKGLGTDVCSQLLADYTLTPPGTPCAAVSKLCQPFNQKGDPDVYTAMIQRYGEGIWMTPPKDAEHEDEWRGALVYYCKQGYWGTGWDCNPCPRELRDADYAGLGSLYCNMLAAEGFDGWSPQFPNHVNDPSRKPGPYTYKIPGATCTGYYFNDYSGPAPTPTPQPTPAPTPAPTPQPTPAPPACAPGERVTVPPGCLQVVTRLAGKDGGLLRSVSWNRYSQANMQSCKALLDKLAKGAWVRTETSTGATAQCLTTP